MGTFSQFLSSVGSLFRWWVVVAPWEQAVRVRWGNAHQLGNGVHLRIPGLDRYYVESTRLRTIDTGIQTTATRDDETITVRSRLRFRVRSYMRVFETLHSPEDTLIDLAASGIAEAVRAHDKTDLTPEVIEEAVNAALNASDFGLADLRVTVTDFAFVRTYRLIMSDGVWTRGAAMAYTEVGQAGSLQ